MSQKIARKLRREVVTALEDKSDELRFIERPETASAAF